MSSNGRTHFTSDNPHPDRKSVTDSKADLVSMEMESGTAPHKAAGGSHQAATFTTSTWQRRTRLERFLLVATSLLLLVVIVVLAITIDKSIKESSKQDVCYTSGCINAAHTLLENMDPTVDPCDDFYLYSCGGFEKRVRIPDDQSSRSQFAIIDDELEEQLRGILESNETDAESSVFKMARDN